MRFDKAEKLWGKPKSNLFVYGLVDPRNNQLVYIGQTNKGIERIERHSYCCLKRENPKKVKWVKELRKFNLMFEVIYFEYCNDQEELNQAETFYIQYFRGLGSPLFNYNDGGDNHIRAKMTPERLKDHKILMKQVMNKPEVKRRMSLAHKSTKIKDQYGIIYNSISEAARQINCSKSYLSEHIKGKWTQVKGYIFTKVTE